MTKEQLDDIRAVIAECRRLDWTTRLVDDAHALLAEVERLRSLFDQSRHQIADALGVDRGYGWASLAAKAAQQRASLTKPEYVFRGGYIEDENGDRWWSAGLLAKVEAERDKARAEVERLNALGAFMSADIQRLTRRVAEDEADWMALRAEAATAFSRGVAAMREAAIEWAWRNFVLGAMASVVVRDLRALPDPEYNNGK